MPKEQYLFAMLVSVVSFLLIFELVRQRKLKEEFTAIWFFLGLGIIFIVNSFEPFILRLTAFVGATTSTTLVFILAILALLGMCLHLSIRCSHMSDQIKNLTQEVAIASMKRLSSTEYETKTDSTQKDNA